jgi:hypothetical protein
MLSRELFEMDLMSSSIFSFSSFTLAGFVLKMLSFMYPQRRKKLGTVRSGDLGGGSLGFAVLRFGPFFNSVFRFSGKINAVLRFSCFPRFAVFVCFCLVVCGFTNNHVGFAVLHVFSPRFFEIFVCGFAVLGTPKPPPPPGGHGILPCFEISL